MPPRILTGAVCALLLLTSPALAGGPLRSGPPVGSANDRQGFLPQWVSGPCAGKRLCPV
jgi:hypothetical protein